MSSAETITREFLLDDNRSETAADRIQEWDDVKQNRLLIAVWACSDSRLRIPYRGSIHIFTLAAGGPRSPWQALLADQRIKADVIVSHYDGRLLKAGQNPGGCGARDEKERIDNQAPHSEGLNGSLRFIQEHVWDKDLLRQTYNAAAFTAYRSGRPVLGTAQDHITLDTYPLQLFTDRGKDVRTEVPHHLLTAPGYFPQDIYATGLPVLPSIKIPPIFNAFLAEAMDLALTTRDRYSDLAIRQETQNPRLLVVSTDVRPFEVRYPTIGDRPGEVFKVSVPQLAIDGIAMIHPKNIFTALEQAHYPVTNKYFYNLETILIETRSMEKSETVARELLAQEWMRDSRHQILIAQVNKGETQAIQLLSR